MIDALDSQVAGSRAGLKSDISRGPESANALNRCAIVEASGLSKSTFTSPKI